jgi:signal transduction histidine kinase
VRLEVIRSTRRDLAGILVGCALIVIVSAVVWPLDPHAPVGSLGVLYLLAVLPIAILWGVVPAVAVAILGVATYAFVFVPPRWSFAVNQSDVWLALVVVLVVAVVVGELAARQRRERVEVEQLREEQAGLGRVATLVAQGAPPTAVFDAVTREVGLLCDAELARTERYETDGTVSAVAAWTASRRRLAVGTRFAMEGASIAALVRDTHRPARIDTFADTSGPIADEARAVGIRSSIGCPILVGGRVWGVVAASRTIDEPFPPGMEAKVSEFTELAAIAIANAENEAELRASRARLVTTADDARRRIERDLHDGVQQRLVSLALDMRRVQQAIPPEFGTVSRDIARIAETTKAVLDELVELARGIHPAILSKGGIEPALKALVRRSPLIVDVDVRVGERLPGAIEVAAYYIVAELLTNASKYANASTVRLQAEHKDGRLRVAVHDDGVGGADPARGSGLVGLRDRVEALGGSITIDSPVGDGTSVRVELPLMA